MVAFVVVLFVMMKRTGNIEKKIAETAAAIEKLRSESNVTGPQEDNATHITHKDREESAPDLSHLMELRKALDSLNVGGDPGGLRFDDPDIKKLVDGLGNQFRRLEERQKRLDALNREVERQLAEIGSYTNAVTLARQELQREYEARNLVIRQSQSNRLGEMARLYERMMRDSLTNAITAIKLNPPAEIARIQFFMLPTNQATIFNQLVMDSTPTGRQTLQQVQDAYKKIIIETQGGKP